eukprot:CAMPEP_0172359004 /NCGR_PEP_ID=MMETSP1060-20121228/3247_1 /TAXON_ID=37318 /ORGANISM="Pseudo-nitzschia pungens, Strain cf. cingulata" /LENGTH=83 /DNA_ID=CAMNT_0013080453 /DNA_START=310 /DNA_END=561 /DNA_ORIENTATION=-
MLSLAETLDIVAVAVAVAVVVVVALMFRCVISKPTKQIQYRWNDGRVYKGDWVDGKAHGHGIETRADGSLRHDGQWEDDFPKL